MINTKELSMETLERIGAYMMPFLTRLKMLGVIDPDLGKEIEKLGKDFDPTEIARIIQKAIASAVSHAEHQVKMVDEELVVLYEDKARLEITLSEVLDQMNQYDERSTNARTDLH